MTTASGGERKEGVKAHADITCICVRAQFQSRHWKRDPDAARIGFQKYIADNNPAKSMSTVNESSLSHGVKEKIAFVLRDRDIKVERDPKA